MSKLIPVAVILSVVLCITTSFMLMRIKRVVSVSSTIQEMRQKFNVEVLNQKELPPSYRMATDGNGEYRYIHPDGRLGTFTHDSYNEAVKDAWEMHKLNIKDALQVWSDIPDAI